MGFILKDNVKTLIEVAAKCGGFTRELAETMGVKYRRLKQLEELKYINKPNKFMVKEDDGIKTKYIYTLAKEGEKLVKNESIALAVVPINGYEHTKAAERIYLDLRKSYDAEEILNESEQRYHLFKDEIEDIERRNINYSIPDFCIIKEFGDFDFVEVVTKNYRNEDFIKKENYCSYFNKTPNYKK